MPLSDASSEIAPSLAELTTLTVAVTTVATADRPAPEALASSNTTERTVFPVTILWPTNSSNQAPANRHDENDEDQRGNVTLCSSDVNNSSSRQQTRPNSNAERDDDDGGTNSRRRIDPQRFLHRKVLSRVRYKTDLQLMGSAGNLSISILVVVSCMATDTSGTASTISAKSWSVFLPLMDSSGQIEFESG